MAPKWQDDPSYFLRCSGPTLAPEIWKLKNITYPSTVPLKGSDFDLTSSMPIQSFTDLARQSSTWNDAQFQQLLRDIRPNSYLVNNKGLVLVETPGPNPTSGGMDPNAQFKWMPKNDLTKYGLPGDKEPWMNTFTPGNHWVSSDRLRQNRWTRSQPLGITRWGNQPLYNNRQSTAFTPDNTTNVHHSYFSRPMVRPNVAYPLKIVVLQDLGASSGRALFDPNVWGWYNNAGTCYVARQT